MPISAALGSSALLPAGLGFRNLLINGNMRIAQRGTAAVSTNNSYAVDRWVVAQSTTGAWTAQQVTTASAATLSGFDYAYKFTKTTGNTPAAGDYNYFVQGVEGNNIAGLSWGTSAAKPVTLSFWVYSGATGTFGGSIRNPGGPFWAYAFSYTVNSANTWEYKSISIPGVTSGSWPTDNNVGFSLFFDLGSGANARLTAGSWQSGTNCVGASGTSQYPTNTSGGYLYITGVQLEQNTQPTPFEQRPHGVELSLCQRYYYRYSNPTLNGGGVGYLAGFSSTRSFGTIHIPVEMRGAITITPTSCTVDSLGLSTIGSVTAIASYATTGNAPYTTTLFVDCTTTNTVAGTLYHLRVVSGGQLQFSAEI